MNGMGSKIIQIIGLVVLMSVFACGAYTAGFGSGYYMHARLAADGGSVDCPAPEGSGVIPPAPTRVGKTPVPPANQDDEHAFDILWEILDVLREGYYGELPSVEELANGAARGMLQTLDDKFTSYIEPKLARVINEDASGSFEGIGALIRMNDDNKLEISRPFQGQPAEKAGVQAGDIIVAIDGKPTLGLGLYEAIGLIRGPAGSKVTLTLQRKADKPFDVTITRAKIQIPIVESKMLEGDIAYISLYEFSAPATERMEKALKELLDRKPKGLVFDLRDNPGGFLNQAISVADLFMDSGIVAIERTSDGQEKIFRATSKGLAQDIPVVVLVNGGSASASEIVAGALQDSKRAILLGEKTFGKGSVQMPHTLANGGELRVTIARWFTPNDRAIHGEGLTPDIKVTLTIEDAKAGRDPQLDRAVEYLTTGK